MHALLMTLLCAAPVDTAPISILVLPVAVRAGASTDLAETLTEELTTTLRRLKQFRVMSMRELEGAMSQEQRRQIAGCDTQGCAAEIGGGLNADEILMGTLAKVDTQFHLSLSRVKTRTGASAGSSSRRFPLEQESALLDAIPAMIVELTGYALPPAPRAEAKKKIAVTPASLGASPSTTAQTARRIAVTYFDNTGKNAELDLLGKGLADMLITDIAQVQSVKVVEREKLNEVMAEMKLQRTAAFDASTVQQLGKLLGAEYILVGSYFELMGQFRMDARLVRVATGEVVLAHGVKGRKDEFMELENTLAMKIVDALDVPVTTEERQQVVTAEGGTFADAVDYGRAVQAVDDGDSAGAQKQLASITQRMPLFRPARILMARLSGGPR